MPESFMDFFPYSELKPGQREVLEFTNHVVSNSQLGLIEAYCGFGKTISTFAPALAQGRKIILLTPTYSARNSAVAEVLRINKLKGKKLKVADLRGKNMMCSRFSKEKFSHESCTSAKADDNCSYFRNSFAKGKTLSKKAQALKQEANKRVCEIPEFFFANKSIDSEPLLFEKLQKVCKKRRICFYELSKALASDADVVILDYFWVFTGIYSILSKLLNTEEFVLLVDEADLLADRIYNSYHNQLGLQALQRLQGQSVHALKQGIVAESDILFLEEFRRHSEALLLNTPSEKPLSPSSVIDFYTQSFRQQALKQGLKGEISFDRIVKNIEEIIEALRGFAESEKSTARPDLFLRQLESIKESEGFLTFIPHSKDRILVKPFEINSIRLSNGMTIRQTLLEFQSALLFSATIGEPALFLKEFGLEKSEVNIFRTLEMPHDSLLFVLDTELSSLYSERAESFPKYIEKIRALMAIDKSLLVSFCNQGELEKALAAIPELQDASALPTLDPEQSYALNIRTKSARSTNKARHLRNCMIVGLPLPDYSDFYLKERRKYLEAKYGKFEAGKIINRKAVDNAVQFIGRITRDLKSPRAVILADSRYYSDYFLKKFYYNSLPQYYRKFMKFSNFNPDLERILKEFWKKE